MESTFNSLSEITGLPFKRKGNRMVAACYMNGSPHPQHDKTYAIIKPNGIYIKENGGDDISLKEWLEMFGDVSQLNINRTDCVKTALTTQIHVSLLHFESSLPATYSLELFAYLRNVFGFDKVDEAFRKYRVGESLGKTIFWYINKKGQVCHDQSVSYGNDGKRKSNSRKFGLDDGYTDKCVFGEHLLKGWNGEVAVVESEKTAIIMSILERGNRIWVATGGSAKLSQLHNGWILFPDYDNAGAFWECFGCKNRSSSDCIIVRDEKGAKKAFGCSFSYSRIERWWEKVDGVEDGWDVADYVLNKYTKR